ncbi:hypothetical protein [Nocardia farcinica]|uniref:hypothetical protein n=1 Tax=Nocardia farcinica TaxID=37329 RepID=UPI002458490A|nr:hypothetical protein [Nocardia farcinica]
MPTVTESAAPARGSRDHDGLTRLLADLRALGGPDAPVAAHAARAPPRGGNAPPIQVSRSAPPGPPPAGRRAPPGWPATSAGSSSRPCSRSTMGTL